MDEDYFKSYLDEIKSKYDIEKKGVNSTFLLIPTRAKLRNLCIEKFTNNLNNNDLTSFTSFMGFEFSMNSLNRIRDNTDKFRPIETFLKGETTLSDISSANMAAILIDFDSRPFTRFRDLPKKNIPNDKSTPEVNNGEPIKPKHTNTEKLSWLKKNINHIAIGTTLFIMVFIGMNYFLDNREEMGWLNDHYEVIDSENKTEKNPQFIINLDEKLLTNFRKITPCDTTSHVKNGKACLWYGKSAKGEVEFFTALGFHPETGKSLKEVTSHIMNKYGKGPCN